MAKHTNLKADLSVCVCVCVCIYIYHRLILLKIIDKDLGFSFFIHLVDKQDVTTVVKGSLKTVNLYLTTKDSYTWTTSIGTFDSF